MKLVDLKKSKKELKQDAIPCEVKNQNKYPYGTEIRFETEELDKLPALKNVKVGQIVKIEAQAKVVSMRQSDNAGGEKSRTVALQITNIGVETSPEDKSPAEYRKWRNEGGGQ